LEQSALYESPRPPGFFGVAAFAPNYDAVGDGDDDERCWFQELAAGESEGDFLARVRREARAAGLCAVTVKYYMSTADGDEQYVAMWRERQAQRRRRQIKDRARNERS
jgi:hypothetical protein